VKQQTQLMKQITQSSDFEYKLFMHYHNKLSDIPSLVDLTSHFVAANIITSSDGEAITSITATESQASALIKLLSKISMTLLCSPCGNKLLNKMLRIMQIYGNDTAKLLAAEMLESVVRNQLQSIDHNTSTDTGVYIRIIDS